MLSTFFESFQSILAANQNYTVILAFVWGLLSILLSPCHLSGIPLTILGLQNKSSNPKQVIWKFSLGIFLSIFIFIGFVLTFKGLILLLAIPSDLIMFVVLFSSGLLLLELLHLNSISISNVNVPDQFLVVGTGVVFGLLIGPCTIAFAMPVLTASGLMDEVLSFASLSILLSFSLGHLVATIGIGTSVSRASKWISKSLLIEKTKMLLGIVLILVSFYFLYRFGQNF